MPEEWRAWALEQIRAPEWGVKSAAWQTVGAGGALTGMFVMLGSAGTAALFLVGMFLFGLLSMDFRRREALDALATGRSYDTVRLRWWDLLLALAIVAGVSLLAMVLFTP